MAWSGGTYTRSNGVYSGSGVWAQDRDAAVKILAARHDTHDQDLATGINTCLTKDGQNSPTANLPMGNFIHTGVGAATARTNYAAMSQVQDGTAHWIGTTGGSANTQTGTLTPTITSYTTGLRVRFEAGFTNTGAATLNLNSVGAANIRKGNGSIPLTEGDLTAGDQYEAVYDGSQFILLNLAPLTLVRDLNTTVTISNTTTETTLFTATIPGGAIGTHRSLRFFAQGDLLNTTGSACNFNIRLKLGATTLHVTDTPSMNNGSNRASMQIEWRIFNRNSQAIQHSSASIRFGGFGTEATAGTLRAESQSQSGGNAATEDTSSDKTLVVTGQMPSAPSPSASAQIRLYKAILEIV